MKFTIVLLTSLSIASCKTDSGSEAKNAETTTECENYFNRAKEDHNYTDKIETAFAKIKENDLTLVGCRTGILGKHTEIDPGNKTSFFAELSYKYKVDRGERANLRLYLQTSPEIKVFDLTRTQGDEVHMANKSDLIVGASSFYKEANKREQDLLAQGYKKVSTKAQNLVSIGEFSGPDSVMYFDVEVKYEKPQHPTLLSLFRIKEVERSGNPYMIPYKAVGFETVTGVEF